MKALKSDRANTLLADPAARGQLRAYLASRATHNSSRKPDPSTIIEMRSTGGEVLRLRPIVVPKAA